ncbi:MAG: SDR family NAD(P)-dependent oxidoreductase [Alphaproteobacteria bacterium]
MQDVKGKTAVVTGGNSGIGLGIARALAAEGANLVLVGMDHAKAENAAATLARDYGVSAIGVRCDVTNRQQVETMADKAYAEFGNVDILINNAGLGAGGPIHEITEGDWDWVMAVNVKGIFHCCAVFLPRMLAAGRPAHVSNMGSEQSFGLADASFGSMVAYTASKHAVLGISESMRRDHANDGIEVSIICPGPVATDIWNAERNRPAEFGDKREVSPEGKDVIHDMGMDPDVVGRMTVEGIKAGDFYIFTHSYIRDLVKARHEEALTALEKTDAWHRLGV